MVAVSARKHILLCCQIHVFLHIITFFFLVMHHQKLFVTLHFFYFVIPFTTFTLAEIPNLFTDWELSSSDSLSALDNLDVDSSLTAADLTNDNMFAFSDAPEFLAGAMGKCSTSSTFPSRRRSDTTCDANDGEDEVLNDIVTYRNMALYAKEQLSKLDQEQCLGDNFPYLICSSHHPADTEWVPSLLSYICRHSVRGKSRLSFSSSRTRNVDGIVLKIALNSW